MEYILDNYRQKVVENMIVFWINTQQVNTNTDIVKKLVETFLTALNSRNPTLMSTTFGSIVQIEQALRLVPSPESQTTEKQEETTLVEISYKNTVAMSRTTL